MIENYTSFLYFVKRDLKAHGLTSEVSPLFLFSKTYLSKHYVIRFQILLRFCEYLFAMKDKNGLLRLIFYFFYAMFKSLSKSLGFSIPLNVFGPGLAIVHVGTIVVNHGARVGANCRIHVCVNIGASGSDSNAPKLGDNIYIGPGVKIFGNITIANNIVIGANAVVNKDLDLTNMVYAGLPAKPIKSIDIRDHIKGLDV